MIFPAPTIANPSDSMSDTEPWSYPPPLMSLKVIPTLTYIMSLPRLMDLWVQPVPMRWRRRQRRRPLSPSAPSPVPAAVPDPENVPTYVLPPQSPCEVKNNPVPPVTVVEDVALTPYRFEDGRVKTLHRNLLLPVLAIRETNTLPSVSTPDCHKTVNPSTEKKQAEKDIVSQPEIEPDVVSQHEVESEPESDSEDDVLVLVANQPTAAPDTTTDQPLVAPVGTANQAPLELTQRQRQRPAWMRSGDFVVGQIESRWTLPIKFSEKMVHLWHAKPR